MTYQTLDLKELNLNFNNMAIDFYELGKRGYKTPKTKQSGLQSLVGSIDKTVGGMLKASQEKTAELTASMTAGVPIDKVPEELRGQVTDFLTGNKKAYTEATKVIASGVNPQSEQYKNAVETINSVNTKFENLSGNLENIALERQKYLDDPSYSPNTSRSDATTMSDLANGSLYNRMSLNEDGSWNYTDTKGESKAFKDFKVNKQGYLGQQGFIAMTEHLDKNALDINGDVKKWEGGLENYYSLQLDQLFNKLGPKGSQDYVMADDEFLQARYDDKKLDGTKGSFEDYKDALTQGSKEEIVKEYKQYNLDNLRTQHEGAVAKAKPGDGPLDGDLNNFSIPAGYFGDDGYVGHRDDSYIRRQAKDIDRGKDKIPFGNKEFQFDEKTQKYNIEYDNNGVSALKMVDGELKQLTKQQVADRMGIDLSLIKSGDPDIQADAADTKTGTTYAIMGEDSDTVADNWNKILLPMDHVDNPKGYHFKKMKRQGKGKKLWPFGKEEHDQKIALYDNKDRPVSFKDLELFKTNPLDKTHYGGDYVNYPTVSFRTGDSMGKQKDTYNEILKTLRGKGIDLFDNDGL
tara:strand:- start:763 stop:2487 length:1725 start_codon:yes stop_codon:yes gene_type:complete